MWAGPAAGRRNRNTKINAPVAGILCQCNAAVMPDRCSVRAMARDSGLPARAPPSDPRCRGRFATDVVANFAVPGRRAKAMGRD